MNESNNLAKSDNYSVRIEQLIEHSRQALAMVLSIQDEITSTHQQLGQGFHGSLEERIRRLSIERDEALLHWSHALLELNTHQVELQFKIDQHTILSAAPQEEIHYINGSMQANQNSSNTTALADGMVVLGDPYFKSEETQSSYDIVLTKKRINPSQYEKQKIHQEVSPSQDYKRASISRVKEDSILSSVDLDDSDYDPGLADAETISLTQFSISELKAQMTQPKTWQKVDNNPPKNEEQWRDKALNISKRLGKPKIYNSQEIKTHLLDLESEVECCQQWSIFDRDVQNHLLTIITSRLRKIQDFMEADPFDQDRIAKMFRRLTRFSSDFRPGFIHGLSRDKIPAFDSWEDDEHNAWNALRKYLDVPSTLSPLAEGQRKLLQEIIDLIKDKDTINDFSSLLRDAVGAWLNAGMSPESPHLAKVISKHLSYLSGKRFKKVRLAVHTLN
jgi:hypothetical protein